MAEKEVLDSKGLEQGNLYFLFKNLNQVWVLLAINQHQKHKVTRQCSERRIRRARQWNNKAAINLMSFMCFI